MDSITQIALGAAVSVAVLGEKTSIRRATIFGGILGTLPDLDVFIQHGDVIRNMTMHRAESHAIFYLTLAAPLIGYLGYKISGQGSGTLRFWILAAWAALVTHPLLDTLTIYGTQLGLPFTNHPYAVGSVFILDLFYTVPLIAGIVLAGRRKNRKYNKWGLIISSMYLALGIGAQSYVRSVAANTLTAENVAFDRLLLTTTPLNIVGWRIVALSEDEYREGFYSFLRPGTKPEFIRRDRGADIARRWKGDWNADRIAWFTQGFYRMDIKDSLVTITDLRMGQEPNYSFAFAIGRVTEDGEEPVKPFSVASRPKVRDMFNRMSH